MVKPGGTGSPRLAISARLAPLPPSKSRISALPSALPSPKVNTHFPDFAAAARGLIAGVLLAAGALLAEALRAGLAAALAGLFLRALSSALRAEAGGAAFARAGLDGFDFAAIFLDLARALAMTENPREEGKLGAL